MGYEHIKKQGLYDPRFEHDSCGVGFVCNIRGGRSNEIVRKGLDVLKRLSHRGAVGADPKTGDGAGILLQIPHEFLKKVTQKENIKLPDDKSYGVGLVFLPQVSQEKKYIKKLFERYIRREGLRLIGWRTVPVNSNVIGHVAQKTQPIFEQVFIGRRRQGSDVWDRAAFERKLYLIRKQIENKVRSSGLKQKSFFYISNLSSRTLSYKGLLMPEQLSEYFSDLNDESIVSSIALVHSRYSTNTFPTWDLAQPFRFLAHNGEINTLRGNINWMQARESQLENEIFSKNDIKKIKPVILPGGSDSAILDNVFELLVLSGRSLPHAMMMLIPQAWEHDPAVKKDIKDFYRYHACFMEPWDGPAAIAFTDGTRVGAVLDRNGLRPARYIVTTRGMVIMASEVGVLDIRPEDIARSGRLEPGKIFYIDTEEGSIIGDEDIKSDISKKEQYGQWLKDNLFDLDDIPRVSIFEDKKNAITELKKFGYTREDMKYILLPMAEKGKEPVGSMGNDTPHAVLSKRPQLLYNYFHQLFAQVTNPPIDPIREDIVMSLESYVGPQRNIIRETEGHCHKLYIRDPILSNEDIEKIRTIRKGCFRTKNIPILFNSKHNDDLDKALKSVCRQVAKAIKKKYSFIILSDRNSDRKRAAIPALLATSAVHNYLVKMSLRTQIGIIVESAEPREVHHFALLLGYGADCVNPYLAYKAVEMLVEQGDISLDIKTAVSNFKKAVSGGIMKILSKMGISTLNSYRGAQIFEALGLSDKLVKEHFGATISRIGGIDLDIIAKETLIRHRKAYDDEVINDINLATGGIYQWKKDGESHLWNPETISSLQEAVRKNDYPTYKRFARSINDQSKDPTTLRGLLMFKKTEPVPIEEVEPVESILKRFATGAMSFGSISKNTHETLAIAMNRIGGRSNTGEGGEDPARFKPLPNGDSKRSAIKQVASGRFGVTTNYLVNADELQIKMAQGAKPGEGGQLPGHKVSPTIARIRYTSPGVTLISPPPHHDIYSIEDLAQLIFDLKNTNPSARISVKLVSEAGVGTVAAGVAKGHADMILISGGDGGTGASPLSSIRHAGLPWELGLAETHQTLVINDLRSRVRLQTDGQMRTGRDVAIAAILGAEEFGFCTSVLVTVGCVMLRHCHLNNCSVGVATQDEELSDRFSGKPENIINYLTFVAQELREIMASIGIRKVDELIGRTDLLEVDRAILPWKAKGIDLSGILYKPDVSKSVGTYFSKPQNHNIERVLDRKLIEMAANSLSDKKPVKLELYINNINRTAGAMLSGKICKMHGESGLPDNTIHFKFSGVAGQSFGAFLSKGITFELEGLANDYVGKGISGGKIMIYPSKDAHYIPENNIIIGNTAFYGAISGEAYIRGIAGERFCIRNSGLNAVVEGVGDHGCEYMTGGRVIVLGQTGRNFAAGMSGGIAYIYDKTGDFNVKCNMEMVEFDKIDTEDKQMIQKLLQNHINFTKSPVAKRIINDIDNEIRRFVKVMPIEYKRVLEEKKIEEKDEDLSEVSDG